MTTASPGGRPCAAVNVATSSATAGADLGGDRAALEQPGACRSRHRSGRLGRRDGLARLAAADGLRGSAARGPRSRRGSSVTRAVVSPSNSGVADRRQVDEDVRRGAPGGRLAEERGDVRGRSTRWRCSGRRGLGRRRRARGRPRRSRSGTSDARRAAAAHAPSVRAACSSSVSCGSFSAAANPA